MAELITQVGSILTGIVGWSGTILNFITGEPLLLIPVSLTLIGGTVGFVSQVKSAV